MSKKGLITLLAGVLVVIVVIGTLMALQKSNDSKTTDKLMTVANSFPAISGSTVAFPDNKGSDPPSATKAWYSTSSLEAACQEWREAYRQWIGGEGIGSVTGAVTEGQSCSYSGKRGDQTVALQVAVYGEDPKPIVTLEVTNS